ncbi:MAG: putative O-glycosylation ligase, exosortase A system-associated [Novosphingobium sp.]|nr:putative O-glycosylation ligase, exosortase A system-associated [Novosphingobium sp.]
MLELALLGFLGGLLLLGFKRPFLWVLAYIYVDLFAPQRIGWAILPHIPLSLIMFAAAFGGWLVLDNKAGSRFSFRQGLILALLALCALSLTWADFPVEAAEKWDWVWKSLVFAIFLPLTLTNRLRLEGVALFMVLSVGAIAIDGGIKTVMGGGGYGTLSLFGVSDDSGIYEGSTLSTAVIAIIPLIVWLARFGTVFRPSRAVTLFAAALVFACLLIPVGTSTRTGLLCIIALGGLVMRTARHRVLLGAIGAFAVVIAIPFLPQSFTQRMSTIETYHGDQSASTRLAVWKWTLDRSREKPFGGGFDAYLANSFTYQMKSADSEGSTTVVRTEEVTEKGRAYHSAYFEMLGEQGWPGLAIWLLFHVLGLFQMERIRHRFRTSEDYGERRLGQLANALQQGHLVYMVGALFTGVAYQPFIYLIASLEIGLAGIVAREMAPAGTRRPPALRKARPGQASPAASQAPEGSATA